MHFSHYFTIPAVQKKKFSIKDFFSKLKKKFGQCRQKSCESLLNAFIAIKWYDNEVAKERDNILDPVFFASGNPF